MSTPEPAVLDPADFDAIGVLTDIVLTLRRHAFERQVDVTAFVSAPAGRHALDLSARAGGHVVLGVRYDILTPSRRNVLIQAFDRRGWDENEDGSGVTRRFPPGTEASDVAFEALGVLALGGTPPERRTITAVDATGAPVALG